MAVFTKGVVPWNSLDDNTRLPLTSELESGYPCGHADQKLFNYTAGYSWGQVHNAILNAGLVPDGTDLTQLATAIQSGLMNFAIAGGTANAITVTLSPDPISNIATQGMAIRVIPSLANTGPATLAVNGMAPLPIYRVGGRALQAGDLNNDSVISMVGTGTSWQIVATSSTMSNKVVYTASGSYSFTVPAGVRWIMGKVWGGGGGGGGGANTAIDYAGCGGGGGGYDEGWISVTPGQVITITVGAGGLGGPGLTQGGNGGTSSISSFIAATGGIGGKYENVNATQQTDAGSGSSPSGLKGGWGGMPIANGTSSNALGGSGGNGANGGQGGVISPSIPSPGAAPGGGGGGAGGPGGLTGGAGAPGRVEIIY